MRRPTETAFHHYPVAIAMCDCEATHDWDDVPCISVRRADGMDRCMECNQRWPAASQGSLELVVPCPKFEQRGVPCVPDGDACAQCGNQVAA
jgi:hypothetical protein